MSGRNKSVLISLEGRGDYDSVPCVVRRSLDMAAHFPVDAGVSPDYANVQGNRVSHGTNYIGAPQEELYGSFPRREPAEGYYCPHRAAAAGYPTPDMNGSLRGILRNKDAPPSIQLQAGTGNSDETLEYPIKDSCLGTCCGRYMRPSAAELVAVAFGVFVLTLVESELSRDASLGRVGRVGLLSLLEAAVFAVFLLTFHGVRIQMSPAITLGCLFAGNCRPLLCILNLGVQLVAATAAVLAFKLLSMEDAVVVAEIPVTPNSAWILSVYRIVLGQTVSSGMLVLVYLSALPGEEEGVGGVGVSSGGVAAAVGVSSLVSLLSSTASWNPVRSLAAALTLYIIDGNTRALEWHYVFWLGPIIGSLFASFIYRLVFAGSSRRFIACDTN